jgi:glycosyltransferase involved in cell wall biosynthesis
MRKMSEKLSWGNICIGDFIIKWYGTKPTYISYGAVENPPYKQNDKTFKKESALFIGRLDDQTGILTYVKSIEKIRKSLPKFIMTAIGDGVYRKKITNKINTLGFKDNPEKYLPKFHFAFVSRYLAILEAFAAKRLVFATYDNPVKEDYLKMAPFAEYMVIAETAEQLSEKIQYYLENPQKETKLINEAYKWVQKQSWEEMVNLYLALWKNKN